MGLGIDVIADWTAWLAPLGVAAAWAIERLLKKPRRPDHSLGILIPHGEFVLRGFGVWLGAMLLLPVVAGAQFGLGGALAVQLVAVWLLLPGGDPKNLPWPESVADWGRSLVTGVAGTLVLGTGLSLAVKVMTHGRPGMDWPELYAPTGSVQEIATRLLIIGIAMPFCEEILFRYGLLGWLIPHLGRGGACMAAAALFSAAHLDDRLFVARFAGGAVMGWVYLRRRDIVAPFTVHALINLSLNLVPMWKP